MGTSEWQTKEQEGNLTVANLLISLSSGRKGLSHGGLPGRADMLLRTPSLVE
jgi:hypothetical protein